MTDKKPEVIDLNTAEGREWLAANLGKVDVSAVRIIPRGADKPLPVWTEEDLIVTEADIDRAVRKWDEMMPEEWRGILEAKIVTPKDEKNPGPAA